MFVTRNSDNYVNATRLCEENKKEFRKYIGLAGTQKFLEALSEKMGKTIDELVHRGELGRGKEQATWVHPAVAIHVGQWLSPSNAADAIFFMLEQLDEKTLALVATKKTVEVLQARSQGIQSLVGTMPVMMFVDMLKRNNNTNLYIYEDEYKTLSDELNRDYGITPGEYCYDNDSMKSPDMDNSGSRRPNYTSRGEWLPSLLHRVIAEGTHGHELQRLKVLEKFFMIDYELLARRRTESFISELKSSFRR